MATKKIASGTGKTHAASVHIGLNAVSASHYGGWSGELAACEFDSNDMAAIAKSRGMKSTVDHQESHASQFARRDPCRRQGPEIGRSLLFDVLRPRRTGARRQRRRARQARRDLVSVRRP